MGPGMEDEGRRPACALNEPLVVYAVVRHCPHPGGTLSVLPLVPPGALAVVPLKSAAGLVNALAVVAQQAGQAQAAAQALNLKWQLPEAGVVDLGRRGASAAPCTVDFVAGLHCTVWTVAHGVDTVQALVASLTGLEPREVSVRRIAGSSPGSEALEFERLRQTVQLGISLGRPVRLLTQEKSPVPTLP
jgi:hypothetical protein